MKYFTRELIEMGRSRDHAILSRQEELWDEACARYFDSLDGLKDEMPQGLKHIVASYYLHDAVVQSMGQKGETFLIVVELDTPPRSLLAFTYQLVQQPQIDREALPPGLHNGRGAVEWRHDEIERLAGEPSTWAQSILFSNGWEVKLHFRDVSVMELALLLPPVPIAPGMALSSNVSAPSDSPG
jgi:hypothetical protein